MPHACSNHNGSGRKRSHRRTEIPRANRKGGPIKLGVPGSIFALQRKRVKPLRTPEVPQNTGTPNTRTQTRVSGGESSRPKWGGRPVESDIPTPQKSDVINYDSLPRARDYDGECFECRACPNTMVPRRTDQGIKFVIRCKECGKVQRPRIDPKPNGNIVYEDLPPQYGACNACRGDNIRAVNTLCVDGKRATIICSDCGQLHQA